MNEKTTWHADYVTEDDYWLVRTGEGPLTEEHIFFFSSQSGAERLSAYLNALTRERDEAARERDELRAKAASTYVASRKEDIKANYFADDEFRETVCEIVSQVPDGHWITLIVESPEAIIASLTTDKAAQETKDGEGCRFCAEPEGDMRCPYHGSIAESRYEQDQMRDPRA